MYPHRHSGIGEAVVVVLAIAVVARVVWELLEPVVPLLVGLVIVLMLAGWWWRSRERW